MGLGFFGFRFTEPLRMIWLSVLMQQELVWRLECGVSTHSGFPDLAMPLSNKDLVHEETPNPTEY